LWSETGRESRSSSQLRHLDYETSCDCACHDNCATVNSLQSQVLQLKGELTQSQQTIASLKQNEVTLRLRSHLFVFIYCYFSLVTAVIVLQSLVVSLVLSWLDYCNVTLADVPVYLLRRLQCFLNAAVKLVTGLSRSAHNSTSLASLHWLRAAEWIQFKLATLTFHGRHDTAPRYLSTSIHRVADVPSRRRLRYSSTDASIVRPTRLVTVSNCSTFIC